MKLWTLTVLSTAFLLILSGCVSTKPTPKEETIIDDTLPLVELTEKGTISDMKMIALEWKSIDDSRVKGVYIYRTALDSDTAAGTEYYDTVNNRYSTHYLDENIEPNSKYSYHFKTYSENAQSLASKTTTIASLPVMESVSWIHSVTDMPRSAKIIWRPHSNQKVKAYLIQRRTLQAEVWDNLETVKGRLNVEFIDDKLKDKFTYKYRIKSLTYDDITSKPSAEVTVITKALPLEVQNITATTKLPKKIEVKWDGEKGVDFLHFNIYRSKDIDTGYEKIQELTANVYTDVIEEDGARFFYRVSIIDKDGLESNHDVNSVKGLTLNRPLSPALVEAKLVNGKVEIRWSKADERAVSYVVSKRYQKSFFNESTEDFEGIKGTEFIDSEIYTDATYYYIVYSVDKDGIKSEPSIEVMLKTEKNDPSLKEPTDEEKKVVETSSAEEVVPEMQVENVNPNKDVVIINNDFN